MLAGLTRPVPALSFEFTTIARAVAQRCLQRVAALDGRYRFNVALGESQQFAFPDWIAREEMAGYVAGLPHEANSGDLYACIA